jgi:glycolate oxidase iron-sulfur subunit
MLVLDGCVQPAATPDTNAAAARVLDRLGIALLRAPKAGCCGAASHHLSAQRQAAVQMRRNIDAWWPFVEQGVEAIVVAASACGLFVKEYGEHLAHDPEYAQKAARISALAKDLGEVLAAEDLTPLGRPGSGRKVAFHAPCTLQHGQRGQSFVEQVLRNLGFDLLPVADAHLCCGSAGTYSLLQPVLSARLLENKVAALERSAPDLIATANIGCQLHLETRAQVPVHHWIELCGA